MPSSSLFARLSIWLTYFRKSISWTFSLAVSWPQQLQSPRPFPNFFLGEFSRYGSDLLAISELPPEEREDPMSRVFPKMTKCSFHKFGPSGTVEKFDGLCVLPLNIINEKIYLFLWFWFILVTVLSLLQIGTYISSSFSILKVIVFASNIIILLLKNSLSNRAFFLASCSRLPFDESMSQR